MTTGNGQIVAVVNDEVEFPSLIDALGKNITVGAKIVYPSRPGGKGPLQLGSGVVSAIDWQKGELDVKVEYLGEKVHHVFINRTDRVAVVV